MNKIFTLIKNVFSKYFPEFIFIFISVLLAFFLTEWSSDKNEKVSETKILTEIKNGIHSDMNDLTANMNMHRLSLKAIHTFRKWSNNTTINQDSIGIYYSILFRNYTPIINKTGYESLKVTNLKTITNDSLRFQIIKLYEFNYKIIEKLEEENVELQDFSNFYKPTNDILFPYMIFNDKGKFIHLSSSQLTNNQKKELMSYFWRLEFSKKLKELRYKETIDEINQLEKSIQKELNRIN
ncbi:hypothetical protein [Empedobacter brevis]|uniref:hypothetical protein n=1 Tax=Empedobacter brevis TaxID=247 RepID=UPI002FE06962